MRRDLGGGIELDDDPARIDVDAVHDYLANDRTGRKVARARRSHGWSPRRSASLTGVRWILHTRDAHDLYRKVSFGEPSERVLERLT